MWCNISALNAPLTRHKGISEHNAYYISTTLTQIDIVWKPKEQEKILEQINFRGMASSFQTPVFHRWCVMWTTLAYPFICKFLNIIFWLLNSKSVQTYPTNYLNEHNIWKWLASISVWHRPPRHSTSRTHVSSLPTLRYLANYVLFDRSKAWNSRNLWTLYLWKWLTSVSVWHRPPRHPTSRTPYAVCHVNSRLHAACSRRPQLCQPISRPERSFFIIVKYFFSIWDGNS